ncbi:vacuolar protein sorting-associated protein 41 [Peniophora sp. CONT]|nr:vacuolar protein sorting-associated protein 41 [Peniophora sp. CONT]
MSSSAPAGSVPGSPATEQRELEDALAEHEAAVATVTAAEGLDADDGSESDAADEESTKGAVGVIDFAHQDGNGKAVSDGSVSGGEGSRQEVEKGEEEQREGVEESEETDGASSGEEGEEDEDTEDEEDEEDEEPALKYERLGGAFPELFTRDSASCLAISNKLLAFGTHNGFVHVLDLSGKRIRSFKPHTATITDMHFDASADFIGTASIDGLIFIQSISTTEAYSFNLKRPMRTIALEPTFAKSGTRAFICGGMAGTLVMHEKGWLGHKETTLHQGEGPIWQARWRGNLIAWANDLGVKIYDTQSQTRITYVDRPTDAPRADLFKATLHWQDDSTLLIAWADMIKVARVRARPRTATPSGNLPPLVVEITAVFQLDCMIAGIVPHPLPHSFAAAQGHAHGHRRERSSANTKTAPTSFLVLAYTPPDDSFLDEAVADRSQQARRLAERPELRVVSRGGEELAADALTVSGFERWACGDYSLAEIDPDDVGDTRAYLVLSPRDAIVVRPRDRKDHIAWLVEKQRYEEALSEVEVLEQEEGVGSVDASAIGQRYIEHLVGEGEFAKAAKLCPKVCGHDTKRWEDWIFVFAQKHHLQDVIPYVPTESPRLDHLVYEMILAHFLANDRTQLQRTIREWPTDIYDVSAVIYAIQSELERAPSTSTPVSSRPVSPSQSSQTILMECLAELYTANRQPGKALPFFLRLRRANVFDLIREHNLFTDVQDQALLLVEFDAELREKRASAGEVVKGRGQAIELLVDHTYSIPIPRVIKQLESRPYFLFLYLDALSEKDPQLTADFADTQVKLYAEYAPDKLIDFLRVSSQYNLEQAYKICTDRDLVPEMVFLLGRMGNNKQALYLIIDRLGDVTRAIDFAKEQSDDDLWEDLLKYSETRPPFIRGLLENVGAEIDPVRLIRRIKNGLVIPGLQPALIKILSDFNLQISLLEGARAVLGSDSTALAQRLHAAQAAGFFLSARTPCPICELPIQDGRGSAGLLFLCRHVVHARCAAGEAEVPAPPSSRPGAPSGARAISAKIAYTATLRSRLPRGCPVCRNKEEGMRT